ITRLDDAKSDFGRESAQALTVCSACLNNSSDQASNLAPPIIEEEDSNIWRTGTAVSTVASTDVRKRWRENQSQTSRPSHRPLTRNTQCLTACLLGLTIR